MKKMEIQKKNFFRPRQNPPSPTFDTMDQKKSFFLNPLTQKFKGGHLCDFFLYGTSFPSYFKFKENW